MAVFRKLYQPLRFWSCKFNRNMRSDTNFVPNTRKAVALNIVIAKNADIYNAITKNILSNTEWQNLREKILQIPKITTSTVDSMIIDMCLVDFHLDNAIAYFKFLRDNNYPLNIAIIGKYLRLYVLKQDDLTDSDKLEIVNTYNALKEKYTYLDSITTEHCVTSLCLTDEWEETQELIEMIKLSNKPGISVYSALASAAFKNENSTIGWKAMSEITSSQRIPQNNSYKSYLIYCEKQGKMAFNDRIEEMFRFWSENNLSPRHDVINKYINTATKYGWSGTPTTISRIGKCKHCSHSLLKITPNEQLYQELTEAVMNKVIIGKDIYRKTNPKELEKFKGFVDRTKPYDIVIDGLNISYIHTVSGPTIQTLVKVVEHFSREGKKILVLTRKHQGKASALKYIQQHASIFLTDDLSADDPYLLYATIASGKHAMFVSVDLMRQHKHSLKNPLLQLEFKKWQISHQYFVNSKYNRILIKEPFVYMPNAQKNEDCWHIPYVSDDHTYAESHDFPDKWVCLRYNGKKKI